MKNMRMSSYVLMTMAVLVLAGCSDCNCPNCPRTTIVNPAPGTVVTP
jgi:hypothetical protein